MFSDFVFRGKVFFPQLGQCRRAVKLSEDGVSYFTSPHSVNVTLTS